MGEISGDGGDSFFFFARSGSQLSKDSKAGWLVGWLAGPPLQQQ